LPGGFECNRDFATARARSLRVTFVSIVIIFVALVFLLVFVLFLIWLFSKEDISGY
jgi:flagellar biogenesis protein FliO